MSALLSELVIMLIYAQHLFQSTAGNVQSCASGKELRSGGKHAKVSGAPPAAPPPLLASAPKEKLSAAVQMTPKGLIG
jgi:hypothetical protein